MTSRPASGVVVFAVVLAGALSGCSVPPPQPRETSQGHLSTAQPAPPADIPEPVRQTPYLPPPEPEAPAETYTVVVSDVPVKELLFALARDAAINVDVHPDIDGRVTLNAVDQTLFQILDRISRQLAMRYEERNGTIVILPDAPFLRTYKVDYVNVTRDSAGTIGASTLVASGGEGGGEGGGAGGNTSDTTISNTSNNRFWEALQANVQAILGAAAADGAGAAAGVILNRESGLMLVRATSDQHALVSDYLQQVMASVTRQVLIEATIVEVQLNDRYQAGIDWRIFAREGGAAGLVIGSDVGAAFTGGLSAGVAGLILSATDSADPARRNFRATINLLNEFGDTQVLSSPKVMTLNNQPAVLKVVDNEVYFEISIETIAGALGAAPITNVDTDVRTVSVGLVMSVTPQIAETDAVTLNIRPTITRVREFVDDPGVAIALAQTTGIQVANRVPVVQVRETETVMRVSTGQLAILGGLMQDRLVKDDESVPGAAELDGLGELFKFREREQTKTELVIFLRPTVIRTPDVTRDLSDFRRYLPENLQNREALPSPAKPLLSQ